MRKTILITMIILSLVGAADSSYALKEHYAPPGTASCDINETVSCTAVNQSEYSDLYGVPVSAIGIAGYLFLALLGVATVTNLVCYRTGVMILAAAALAALVFSVRMTFVELAILGSVCPLCVISQTLIAAIAALALLAALRR